MYTGTFLFLTSLLVLVNAEELGSVKKAEALLEQNNTSTETKPQIIDDKTIDLELELAIKSAKEAENKDVITVPKEVEEDVKKWINQLDCYNSEMNLMKCLLIKKAYARYNKNPKSDIALSKDHVKLLINTLQEDGYTDKHLRRLIKRHGHLLND